MQALSEIPTPATEQGCIVVRWSGIGNPGEQMQSVDWTSGAVEASFSLNGVGGVTIEIEFGPAPMYLKILELNLRDQRGSVLFEVVDAMASKAGVFVGDRLAVLRSGPCLKILVHELSEKVDRLVFRAERVGSAEPPELALAIRNAFEERDGELERFARDIDVVVKDLSHRARADYSYEEEILTRDAEINRLKKTLDSIYASRLWRSTRPLVGLLDRIKKKKS